MSSDSRRLNFEHLYYFWSVVQEGTVTAAAARLRLRSPTVTSQVRALEAFLGAKLFIRSGRRLSLTEPGRIAFRYADEMFSLADSLQVALRTSPAPHLPRLIVGVFDVVPTSVAAALLAPATQLASPLRVDVEIGRPETLLWKFESGALDLLVADDMVSVSSDGDEVPHACATYGSVIYAAPALAARYRSGFPRSLDGAPFLVPSHTSVRIALMQWFEQIGVRPRIRGELNSEPLMTAMAAEGLGLLAVAGGESDGTPGPGLSVVGVAHDLVMRAYVVTSKMRRKHPAVAAIFAGAEARIAPRPARRTRSTSS